MKSNLLSSTSQQGKSVTQIVHFRDGAKKTFEGVKTDTIRQGQFTQFMLEDGRMIMVNDKNVNCLEVFGKQEELDIKVIDSCTSMDRDRDWETALAE